MPSEEALRVFRQIDMTGRGYITFGKCMSDTYVHENDSQLKGNYDLQGGSNMTGTDLCVNKPQCAEAVRP